MTPRRNLRQHLLPTSSSLCSDSLHRHLWLPFSTRHQADSAHARCVGWAGTAHDWRRSMVDDSRAGALLADCPLAQLDHPREKQTKMRAKCTPQPRDAQDSGCNRSNWDTPACIKCGTEHAATLCSPNPANSLAFSRAGGTFWTVRARAENFPAGSSPVEHHRQRMTQGTANKEGKGAHR